MREMNEKSRSGKATGSPEPASAAADDVGADVDGGTDVDVDVAIVGGGLAGLSLARHLLLDSDKTVLLLERRDSLPPARQKVGEATVQLSGYYFSKVLDLEEHLLREHFMKYNLRFMWPSAGRANDAIEDYAQSYIRPFSNLPSYQLDRNKVEGELLRRNLEDPRFTLLTSVKSLDVALSDDGGRHDLRFRADGCERRARARWIVDTSGRAKFLAKRMKLGRKSPIRHGAYFFWADGLVDIEKLTGRSRRERRLARERRHVGHLPQWLATNHFAGEGYWLWVIPLQGKTSFGLVFDREKVPRERVSSQEKLIDWICETFPLFARDLRSRRTFDFAGFTDFAYDCGQAIDPARWALSGESGRFSDPLYSPGGDLIAIHNTLIVDAVNTDDDQELAAKTASYDRLMRSVYEAYVPSYSISYEVLGDQETFSLKYAWELTIYFAFYVFPFINDLFTDRRFVLAFEKAFGRLGPLNKRLQQYLLDYYRWKKTKALPSAAEPSFFDFTDLGPLQKAEKTFYRVGVDVREARVEMRAQLANLEEMARFIAVWVASRVLDEPAALHDAAFVAALEPARLRFDPEAMRRAWVAHRGTGGRHEWSFDTERLAPLAAEAEELACAVGA